MKAINKNLILLASSYLIVSGSMIAKAEEVIVNPLAGGLQTTFFGIDARAIAHPHNFPQDGKGTVLYLKQVCRAMQYDELVSYKIQQASYFNAELQEWQRVDTNPRIYESVTCAVYLY